MALGSGLLVYAAGFFALTRVDAPVPAIAGTLVLACAGLLFVFPALLQTGFGRRLSRQQVDGVATILLAVGWMVASIPLATASSAYGATVLAGGGALAFLGYQGLVGASHLGLPTGEATVRLVTVLLVALALFATAFLVASTM